MSAAAVRERLADEEGYVGGAEVVPFGVLIFVVGILLLASAWGVIDAKQAATGAAREATRAYVEGVEGDEDAAWTAAQDAAEATLRSYGRVPDGMERHEQANLAGEEFGRCAEVTIEVATSVELMALPMLDHDARSVTVTGTHTELVDPLRSGLADTAECLREGSG